MLTNISAYTTKEHPNLDLTKGMQISKHNNKDINLTKKQYLKPSLGTII